MAGRVTFTEENVNKSAGGQVDFPKFKLQKNGDCGRLLVIEDPLAAYIHDLKRPKLMNGQPQTKVETRRDGSTYTDYVMDFISRPLCTGDEGILAERGFDPDHCPACRMSGEGDMVAQPKRRFAMNVLSYTVRPGTTDVALPFQVACMVWSFTDTVFTKLVSFKKENGDLRQHDLLLGPCTNPAFQKYDIAVSQRAEWLMLEPGEQAVEGQPTRRQQLAAQVYEYNKFDDLEQACGRAVKPEWMATDLQKVRDAWAVVNGMGNMPASGVSIGVSGFDQGALRQGLDGLLGGQQPQQQFVQQPQFQADPAQQPQQGFVQAPTQQPAQQPQGDPWASLAGNQGQPAQPQQALQPGDPTGMLGMQQPQAQPQQQAAPFSFGGQAAAPQAQQPVPQSQLPQPQQGQVTTPTLDQLAGTPAPQAQQPVQQPQFQPPAQPNQADPTAAAGQANQQPQAATPFSDLLAGIDNQPQAQ